MPTVLRLARRLVAGAWWIAATSVAAQVPPRVPQPLPPQLPPQVPPRRPVVLNPLRPNANLVGHATPEQVEEAIRRAQQYLFTQQRPDGSFEQPAGGMNQTGGATALVTYALLASGLPSTEPHVAKAVDYLKTVNTLGTYALGLRSQVWYQLSLELDRDKKLDPNRRELERLADRDLQLLLKGVNRTGNAAGMYTYFVNQVSGAFDHSCSNYGTMGVWACAQVGAEVPPAYWAMVERGWKSHQLVIGAWPYSGFVAPNQQGTATMTAGGLVNLFICQEFLDPNKAADCKGNVDNPNIETAIQWLGQQLQIQGNVPNGYLLFNLQRDGFESGYVQFGDYDWYTSGADLLVRAQQANGQVGNGQGGPAVQTAFNLAFLALGRAPVVMSKLQYEDPAGKEKFGHWAQRPRDAANVTRWIEKRLHQRLNWQVVTLDMPMEILHRSPILYIAGNQKLNFTPDQQRKIKQYVLEGGLVLGNADCGSKEFADSFKQLGEQLFPDYAFRPLPAKHPIFQDEVFPAKDEKKLPPISALGNQARELFVLMGSDDPARTWQVLPLLAQMAPGQIPRDEPTHFAANLYYYATERGLLRDKKKTWILGEQPPADKKLTVARLEYDGNWNPEPFGWDQMTQYLRKAQRIELDLPRVHLGAGELDIARFKIAYLTGTGELELTPKQREEIKRFTYEGGIVIVDAAGGSPEFAKSAERELKAAFGRDPELVPPDHKVFTIAANCSTVNYREKAKKTLGAALDKPLLKKIEEDGKIRVFFSPLDLAVGLVGQPIDGIVGYAPDSASSLMMNLLMFGMQQK